MGGYRQLFVLVGVGKFVSGVRFSGSYYHALYFMNPQGAVLIYKQKYSALFIIIITLANYRRWSRGLSAWVFLGLIFPTSHDVLPFY